MARLSVDAWQALRAEYRTGLFSNCQLAEKYAVDEAAIRRRAKKEDWGKDLTVQVNAEINRRLQKSEAQNMKSESPKIRTLDSEIVAAAASSGVVVIQRHRRLIDKGQALVAGLLARIENDQDALATDKCIAMVKELSSAAKNWIDLERRAWSLDTVQETSPLEERLRKIHAEAR